MRASGRRANGEFPMNLELLKSLGQIAGIGGIGLGVFVVLFRDLIRKTIFPQLTKQQGYRVIMVFMILTWSVAIAGIVAWVMIKTETDRASKANEVTVLTTNLWNVELDTKGSLVGTKEVSAAQGEGITQAILDDIVQWVAQELGVSQIEGQPLVEVTIDVPADLEREQPIIKRRPAGPMEVLVWDVRDRSKIRTPLDVTSLRDLRGTFYLEIRVPGYGMTTVEVAWGTALHKVMELQRMPVSIGVEPFEGVVPGITNRLCDRMSTDPGFRVVNPEMLETIREEVKRHNEEIGRRPMLQVPLRKLGVDYIISGSVRTQPRPRE